MELHKKIKDTRIKEICDKYVGESVKNNKPISAEDVAALSCAELIVLYYNTEWLIERSNDDGMETGLENQITLMELIKKRVSESVLYVIHTDATNLPFLSENKSILVYTEKRFADMIACSFNVDYFKENMHFDARMIPIDRESYWQKLRSAGINTVSVDGTKFTLEIDDLVDEKTEYKHTEFCRYLIQYAQAIRLGIHRDKITIFQEAIFNKLKENPELIHGSVVKKGENSFKPIYLNSFAASNTDISKLKTENFYTICKEIFDNKKLTGIVINPLREHIVVPREKILEAFAYVNNPIKSAAHNIKANNEQLNQALVQCSKCGKLWSIDKLDDNGVCPVCVQESKAKNTKTASSSATTQGTHKHKSLTACKSCGMTWPPEKLNKDGLCPTCVYKAQKTQSTSGVKTQVSSGGTQITHTVNRANLNRPPINRPQIVQQERKGSNKALWCLIWSLIPFAAIAECMSVSMGVEAIREAKGKEEAVPTKVWVGLGITLIRAIFFIINFIIIASN